MAHKKGLGSSRNGRDSNPKYLGVKVFAGQRVGGGEIIVRQRGTRFRPGDGTGLGRDHTIFATRAGVVQFRPKGKGRLVSVQGELPRRHRPRVLSHGTRFPAVLGTLRAVRKPGPAHHSRKMSPELGGPTHHLRTGTGSKVKQDRLQTDIHSGG